MAKVVSEMPPKRSHGLYDWDSWLDGQIWELEEGVDFKVSVPSFRTLLCMTAKKRGKKTKTSLVDKKLFIQALGQS